MKIDLPEMHRKAFFGLPFSLNEQRWLLEQVTGEPIIRRRRCLKCDTTGCAACDGKGFVMAPLEAVEVLR